MFIKKIHVTKTILLFLFIDYSCVSIEKFQWKIKPISTLPVGNFLGRYLLPHSKANGFISSERKLKEDRIKNRLK